MPVRGEWTTTGSAGDLRALSRRLRVTGQSGLKKNITKAIRTATVPARGAVKQFLLEEMPHTGGANQWLAKASVTSTVLTGPNTAGVVVRARRNGHDLEALNRTGKLRHPTFGRRGHGQWQLTDTGVPPGWWERVLRPYGPAVRVALREAQNVTAREAGFR